MEVKVFHTLPQAAVDIRTAVFMKEQGFQEEFDKTDQRADHIVIMEGEQAVATCRVYYSEKNQSHMIGRIAVRKEYRGQKLGEVLVREAERIIWAGGGRKVMLFAQKRAEVFYQKQGYRASGYEGEEEGVPHVMMEKGRTKDAGMCPAFYRYFS